MEIRIPGVFWVSLITALIAVLETYATSDWMPVWIPAVIVLLGAVAKIIELFTASNTSTNTMTRGSARPISSGSALSHFLFD